MPKNPTLTLPNPFKIQTTKESFDIAITISNNEQTIAKARLTTDYVDVSCVTELWIDEKFTNYTFHDKHTLADIFIKFISKFPSDAGKPKFRFIIGAPESLKTAIGDHHVGREDAVCVENEILIRTDAVLPPLPKILGNISIKRDLDEIHLNELLTLLQKNAYWQKNLTLDRLEMLTRHSHCFCALSEKNEIVGFARVLTNMTSFASLWDVTVDEAYRGRNIGISLMHAIFSDDTLGSIPNWVLFTDTARGLYEKFGFSVSSVPIFI